MNAEYAAMVWLHAIHFPEKATTISPSLTFGAIAVPGLASETQTVLYDLHKERLGKE